jgi:uncharacterized protein YndB with AHSA1/START domain
MKMNSQAKSVADIETGIILAAIDIDTKPGLIFNALAKAKEIEYWWGAEDFYRMTQWKSNFQVGGDYSVVVLMADGAERPASGTFMEISFPAKISYTRRYDWDFPILGRKPTTITYTIKEIESGSRLTVRHEGFKGFEAAAVQHAEHWERVLSWLSNYLTDMK